MGTSSETTVEKVAIVAIKGTLPLPIGWSRPVISRTNEQSKQEFAVASSQDLIWRNFDSLTQFEEEGFLTTLNKGMEIHPSEIGNTWILYLNENQLSKLPATASILQLFHEEAQQCSQQQTILYLTRKADQDSQSIWMTVIPESRLDTFRSKAFKALFDDIVFCQLSRSTDCNRLHEASLMLVDLASSETEGANGIALSLALLFETNKAAQAQHWLNLVCTKFKFSSSLKEWQLRAESLLASCSFLARQEILTEKPQVKNSSTNPNDVIQSIVEKYLELDRDRFFVTREFEAQSSVRMADDLTKFLTVGNGAFAQHTLDNSMFGSAPVGPGQIAGFPKAIYQDWNAKFKTTRTLPGLIIVNTESNRHVISCLADGEWFRYAINAVLLSELSGTIDSGVSLKIPDAQLDLHRKFQ